MTKSKIIERQGQIALVLVNPNAVPWEQNRVAEMTNYEGTDCWTLVDIRLKRYPQLSQYGCSTSAEDYHSIFTPVSNDEAQIVKSLLREYWEDANGGIHWCTFNGIVRGHPEVNGYSPIRYLNFDQSGYFSRKEAMLKMLVMKAFWDSHEGSLSEARIENPNKQFGVTEMRGHIIIERTKIQRSQRIAALGMLEKSEGAQHVLWMLATQALTDAGGISEDINWADVEANVIARCILENNQARQEVINALIEHSPLRCDQYSDREGLNKTIDAILSQRSKAYTPEAVISQTFVNKSLGLI